MSHSPGGHKESDTMEHTLPGHTLGTCTYAVTCDVEVIVEVSELLLFNIKEKVVHVQVVWANFELPIQVKQLKNRPGMAEDKLLFQMVLF